MNLTACNGCGVVLDKSKLKFAKDIFQEDGSIDLTKAAWNRDEYVPFVHCPVCGDEILESA